MFRIPDFQRGYSWEERQLNDFWMDLTELSAGRNHYIGLLTVEKIDSDKIKDDTDRWMVDERKLNPYFIIDGQQRITTCILLIKALIDNVESLGEEDFDEIQKRYLWLTRKGDGNKLCIFGYERDNPSFEYWKSKILNIESSANEDLQTSYTRNLQFAYDYFVKKIVANPGAAKEVYAKLTTNLKFNFYEIDPSFDVCVAFETMNNRGKDLSKLELLKNRLIYLSSLIRHHCDTSNQDEVISESEERQLRIDINNVWKTIYEFLGKSPTLKLKDDDFLKDHWAMYFGFKKERAEEYAEFLLNEHFTAKRVASKSIKFKHIKEYIVSLQASVKIWYRLFSCDSANAVEKDILGNLNVLDYRYSVPLIMAAYSNSKSEPPLEILSALEKFLFLSFCIYGRRSDYKQTEFMQLAHELFVGEYENGHRCTCQNAKNQIIDKIDEKGAAKKFKIFIADLFNEKDGFFSWNGLKYFLFMYEKHLYNNSNEEFARLHWNGTMTREHILPQTPTDAYWQKQLENKNEIEIHILTHSIGNFLLLNRAKNSAQSAKKFEDKKSAEKLGYAVGTFSEIEVCKYADWNSKSILDRSIHLIRFLEKKWELSFGTDTDISEMLLLNMEGNATY